MRRIDLPRSRSITIAAKASATSVKNTQTALLPPVFGRSRRVTMFSLVSGDEVLNGA
jgi:hypothetical protein